MKVITIHNYQEATKQEIFDFVVNHLLTQKEQSISSKNNCYYKIEKDNKVLKCSAGCLIPDEDYELSIEGEIWKSYSLGKNFPQIIDSDKDGIINELQTIHDSFNVSQWNEQLRILAEKENLKFNF